MRRAGRVEMAFDRIPHGADEIGLVHQREHRLRLGRRDQLGVHAEIAALGVGKAQEVHALGGVGEHHAAGQVQRAGLAGNLLQLLVELHRIGLQLGDVGIAIQRVEAAGRMPGRAGGQLRALDQHDVGPAGLGQMVEHRAADDAAADDNRFDVGFHEVGPLLRRLIQDVAEVIQDVEKVSQAAAMASISSSHFSSKMPVMMVVSATWRPPSASSRVRR